jgi:serine/threonine-protein kinase HipA
MTISEAPTEAFVWTWLPGRADPVVAGRLELRGGDLNFVYGREYLGRSDAIPLYAPELPLRRGRIPPPSGSHIAGVIADAGPDGWGQRVIMNRLLGNANRDADPANLSPLTYLLESGSDRTGALDFQSSPEEYLPRESASSDLEKLAGAAAAIEAGEPLPEPIATALFAGSSLGGARPKIGLRDGERSLIAKFSARDDTYPVVQGEFVAMRLARRAGLDAAAVSLTRALDRSVLLVERFDRPGGGQRKAIVSALTILELGEMMGRYASYEDLADALRRRGKLGVPEMQELFARLTFNVLVGNTDDHARNHSAFWSGKDLALTPAYDICPQLRSGGEASQAMRITRQGSNLSRVADCVAVSASFRLDESSAREIVGRQIATIEDGWDQVCEEAELTPADRAYFWRRQFLNPFSLQGF